MFGRIFSVLKAGNNNEEQISRRSDTRWSGAPCVVLIEGKPYPVENWSFGGFQIKADERAFALDQAVPFSLMFNLSETILNVEHTARVARKGRQKISFQFSPLTEDVRADLQTATEDFITMGFAASQMG